MRFDPTEPEEREFIKYQILSNVGVEINGFSLRKSLKLIIFFLETFDPKSQEINRVEDI